MKIEKKVPYNYKEENECIRDETRENENWYMQQGLTGAEAMRVAQLYMKRLRRYYPEDHYMKYVIESMGEPCMYWDFSLALEEMMDERDANARGEFAPGLTPRGLDHVDWEDCECCDKCEWSSKRKEIKPYIGYKDPQ